LAVTAVVDRGIPRLFLIRTLRILDEERMKRMLFFRTYNRCKDIWQNIPWLLMVMLCISLTAAPSADTNLRDRQSMLIYSAHDSLPLLLASQTTDHHGAYSFIQLDAILSFSNPSTIIGWSRQERTCELCRPPSFVFRLLYTQTTSSCL
jgi:hypothetical protein